MSAITPYGFIAHGLALAVRGSLLDSAMGKHVGVVYAAKYPGGSIKIGSSKRPAERIKDLDSYDRLYGNCSGVVLLCTSIPHSRYRNSERKIHAALSDKRLHGELFNITEQEAFDSITSAVSECDEAEYRAEKLTQYMEYEVPNNERYLQLLYDFLVNLGDEHPRLTTIDLLFQCSLDTDLMRELREMASVNAIDDGYRMLVIEKLSQAVSP